MIQRDEDRGVILRIKNLHIRYETPTDSVFAVSDASLTIAPGEAVGVVGESGSGKSTLARSVLGLLPERVASITGGTIELDGRDVTTLDQAGWEKLRGNPVAMVFQDPLGALNPVQTIGWQIAESVRRHDRDVDREARILELLDIVRLPRRVAHSYPHELSGGMRQRAVMAIALGCRPKLLVADEPTTALDVTTQSEIMSLLAELRREFNMAMLLISHDLALVGKACQRIFVMYAGRTIEWGDASRLFYIPAHPYTRGLLKAAKAQRDENGRFVTIRGRVPNLSQVIPGCPFLDRCEYAMSACASEMPGATNVEDMDHEVRCWWVQSALARQPG
jgi:oligopeptide/dipeptide ABC transporter ATP-binding protein